MKVSMLSLDGNYWKPLCEALAGRPGVDMTLVTGPNTLGSKLYHTEHILPCRIDVHDYSGRVSWFLGKMRYLRSVHDRLLDWVREDRPDVVHIQQNFPAVGQARLCHRIRRLGTKVCVTVHDIVSNRHRSKFLGGMSIRANRTAWLACDALCVHTQGLRDNLAEFLGPHHPPIFVTQHAVMTAPVITPPPTDPVVLFFGIILPYKGLDVLVRAMNQLPDVKLIIAGRPEPAMGMDYMSQIRSMIGMLPEGQVELHDRYIPDDDVAGFFARSRVTAVPYVHFSSQSGVLHLSVGHGRPVVASNIGGITEIVSELGVGVIVPPGDATALADGIRHALEDPSHATYYQSCLKAASSLTWSEQAQQTINAYTSIL